MKILVINGPNMASLHKRGQPYNASYGDIVDTVTEYAKSINTHVEFFVSDIEGEIVQKINASSDNAIVINAAAYSHTSIAIRDALQAFTGIKIEVHMSNVYAREEFRHKSMIAQVCNGSICGFGLQSYTLALQAVDYIENGK